jgi:hypothetical protein
MINRIQNTFKFYIERFILKGARNQFLFIATVIILISVISGTIHYLLYPEIEFSDAVWWAFLRLSDPGYLGDDQGVARRVISTIVTILGYVVFLGSLVAIMTQWLNSTIRRLELGLTPISQKGHILILGWTDRTSIIVREILLSEERVNFFLKRIKRSKLNIVILSEEVNPVIVHELKEELRALWDQRIITFRSGISLKIEHLDRVDFLHAGAIIIPGTNVHYEESTMLDTGIIKTLMTISHYAKMSNMKFPYCITEITDPQKISVIRSTYPGDLEIIASNLIISRLMVQNVRHKGLSKVYSELLKNEGNELYLYSAEEFTGETFHTLRSAFSRAVLVGIMRDDEERTIPLLNPAHDLVIQRGDYLVVLSEEHKTSVPDKKPVRTELSLASGKHESIQSMQRRILIIGWNSKMPILLGEFENYQNDSISIDIFSSVSTEERDAFIKQFDFDFKRIEVTHLVGNSTINADINKLEIKSYETIIMMANDWLDTGEESDARTIMGYMFLKRLFNKSNIKPHFIIELIDPDNVMLFDANDCEVLISSHIISYALSQVALRKRLRVLFDDLFSAGGTELIFKNASYYGIENIEISFADIENEVYRYGDIALGLQLSNEDAQGSKLKLNPDKKAAFKLSSDDQIVILGREQ